MEVIYMEVISIPIFKKNIDADFQGLIEEYYFGKGVEKEIPPACNFISKEFYAADNKLNIKVKFSFESTINVLDGFGITKDKKGDYYYEDIHNDVYKYINGNAESVQTDSTKTIYKWNKNVEVIKYQVRSEYIKNQEKTNVLPYWLKWQESKQDWTEWRKDNLLPYKRDTNELDGQNKDLLSSLSGVNFKKILLGTQMPHSDLSIYYYVISPDNNWLIILPDGYKQKTFILIDLIKYKQIPAKWESSVKDIKNVDWSIY